MTKCVSSFSSADHLRVSLFSSDVWTEGADAIYEKVFGETPETITNKPNANESSALGNWDGLNLEVKRAFNRVDFLLQEPPSESSPVALIKDIQTILPKLSAVVAKWAASQPQGIVRIALGCNAFQQSDSVKDGYIKLRELVKVISVDVDRFREFNFQVNLPVASRTFPEIQINRLSNWRAIILRSGLISTDLRSGPNSTDSHRIFDEKHYVLCGLDVNTDAERTHAIDSSLIVKLLDELSCTSMSILEEGIS